MVLFRAAYTDWKEAKIYNRQIAAGMILWIGVTVWEVFAAGIKGGSLSGSILGGITKTGVGLHEIVKIGRRIFGFCLRMAGTCAVLYPLFICRVIGAGDIKLMGLCVGFSGVRDGSYMVLLGLVLAALAAAIKMYREGRLWERMFNLASFAGRISRERKLTRYQIRYQKADLIPLAPFLLAGYGIYLLGCL